MCRHDGSEKREMADEEGAAAMKSPGHEPSLTTALQFQECVRDCKNAEAEFLQATDTRVIPELARILAELFQRREAAYNALCAEAGVFQVQVDRRDPRAISSL